MIYTLVAKMGGFKIGSGHFGFTRVETPTPKGIIRWENIVCKEFALSTAAEFLFFQGEALQGHLDRFAGVVDEDDEFVWEGPFLFLRGDHSPYGKPPPRLLNLELAYVFTHPATLTEEELLGALVEVVLRP